jgi:hypothetical protein
MLDALDPARLRGEKDSHGPETDCKQNEGVIWRFDPRRVGAVG